MNSKRFFLKEFDEIQAQQFRVPLFVQPLHQDEVFYSPIVVVVFIVEFDDGVLVLLFLLHANERLKLVLFLENS